MSNVERINSENRKSLHLNWNQIFAFGLSIGLGLVLGFLSSTGNWLYALILAMFVPMAIIFSSRPYIGVILWLILMPLSSALPSPDLMYWLIHRLLIPFTLVMTIFPRLVNVTSQPFLRLKFPDISLLILAAYIPLSLLLTNSLSGDVGRLYLDRFLIPILMYFAVRFSVLDKKNQKILEYSAFIVAAIQNIVGIASWIIPSLLPYAWRHNVGYRTAGSLGDPAVFTSVLMFCSVILITAAMNRKNDLIRVLYLLVSGVSFISVFISLERGSWLAGLLVLFALVIFHGKKLFKLILIGGFIVLILSFSLLSKQVTMATTRIGEQHPIDHRIVVTDAMIQMIMEKPVLGWGYDSLNSNLANFYRQVGSAYIIFGFTTSHNTFLTIFTELGLIGFTLYLSPLIWLLIKSLERLRGHSPNIANRRYLMTIWIGSIQYFVVSNFMDMRFFPIGLALSWMILGMVANQLGQRQEDENIYPSMPNEKFPDRLPGYINGQ
jgi:O-antigen ligase